MSIPSSIVQIEDIVRAIISLKKFNTLLVLTVPGNGMFYIISLCTFFPQRIPAALYIWREHLGYPLHLHIRH